MRVLTVGNLYPPHHFGGYEQVWHAAVRHLRDRGHEVRVLATTFRLDGVADGDEPGVHRELRWYVQGQRFVNVSGRERLRIERHNHATLARHLEELEPDVVSFWSMGGMSQTLVEDVRRRGLPMVAFVHDQWLGYGRYVDQWLRIWRGRRRALAPLASLATGLPTDVDYAGAGRYVFVSDFVRRRALTSKPRLDTAVAHSGIDPAFLAPGDERPWRWRLLHVGRLHPDKGIGDAVAALAELPAAATLTFVGSWDPDDEAQLAEQARRLGVGERVRMAGQRTRAEVARLYREHDALLFPVRWDEPWGLVPLEAMACGCPVVATGRGGSGEYLADGENCLLVAAQDPGALAAAVRRLAGDPALRARLRAGGARTAPRYTEARFNAEVERHLLEVAGRPAAEPEPALT